jgi:hypothetical protein
MENLKVFISWSGDRSEVVASALYEWLPMVIQNVDPQFSRENEKGTFWQSGIRKALTTDFGILCLTPENLSTPWVHFEAGSLAKHEEGRVWTLLLCGLEYGAVTPPLSLLHHTLPDEGDVFKMLESINKACGSASLKLDVLRKVFDKNWPDLKVAFVKAAEMKPSGVAPAKRNQSDMIEEILLTTRQLLAKSQERGNVPLNAGGPSLDPIEEVVANARIFKKRVADIPRRVTKAELALAQKWRDILRDVRPEWGEVQRIDDTIEDLDNSIATMVFYLDEQVPPPNVKTAKAP